MSTRAFHRIVATTDVHSALTDAHGLLSHLHQLRATSLVADCGDFFEGTGYYRLGGGHVERQILTTLYDVLAPGNHGWPHYFEPGLREMTVCANTVDADSGKPLFDRLRIVHVQGRGVAVTAVMGLQAFTSIPAHQRAGHRVTDPATALRELMLEHHRVDSWMVLSHSGFAEDLRLAAACPFLDVVFAGHCHSDIYGPVPIGDTLVVKGGELGAGYAAAEPVGSGWAAHTTAFPTTGPLPGSLGGLAEQISALGQQLVAPLGTVNGPYRGRELDRRLLLGDIASRLHTGLGAAAVVLNETSLRTTHLGDVLTLADLLAIEPFDNQLVHAFVPPPYDHDPVRLIADLTERTGPVVTVPNPLPTHLVSVLTTDYLVDTYLGGRTHQAGLALAGCVRRTVTSAPPSKPSEGGTR
jgi:hypothetical protein